MDAGYAVLIEEYTRLGIDLLAATEQTAHMRAGGASPETAFAAPAGSGDPSEAELARQNEKAMSELRQMMGGLGT